MKKEESIKETLDLIRRALEDDKSESDNDILILKMDINSSSSEEPDKKYDIFLWGLYLNGYDKYIWIDTHQNKIIKCEFKNSIINLYAYLL